MGINSLSLKQISGIFIAVPLIQKNQAIKVNDSIIYKNPSFIYNL